MNSTPPKDFIDFIDFTPVKSVNPTRPTAEFSRRLYRHYTHTFRCVMFVNSSSVLSEGRTADGQPPVKSSPQDARKRPHKPLQPRQGKETPGTCGRATSERGRHRRERGRLAPTSTRRPPPRQGTVSDPAFRPSAEVLSVFRVTFFSTRRCPEGGRRPDRQFQPCRGDRANRKGENPR